MIYKTHNKKEGGIKNVLSETYWKFSGNPFLNKNAEYENCFGWVRGDFEGLINKEISIKLSTNIEEEKRLDLLWFFYYSKMRLSSEIDNNFLMSYFQTAGWKSVPHQLFSFSGKNDRIIDLTEEEFYEKYCINFSELFWICTNDRGVELYLDSLSEYKRKWIKDRFLL